jgi:outer membrane murein-binding lipoprotein Lpp
MKLAIAALAASLVLAGCATDPKGDEHAAHHPPGAAAAAPAPAPGQMDSMMKSMQDMHDRLMAAKTPEERARLMQEHMKLMQDGMAMMGRMRGGKGGMGMGGGMSMGPEMMGKRMDMMEMMMQMMMDREGARPPAAR